MKRLTALIILTIGCANASATDWYIGVGTGASKALDAKNNLDSTISSLSAFGISSSYSADEGATAFSLLAGYQVNQNLGIEAAYDGLGTYQVSASAAGGGGSVAVNEEDKVSAVSLSAVLSAPLASALSIYGKAGLAQTTNDATCISTSPGCFSASDSKTGPIFGVGASIVLDGTRLRIEYDRLSDVGDKANEYTAGNFSLIKVEAIYFL